MADHDRTYAVAVTLATEAIAVTIAIKYPVAIAEVAIAVPEDQHIVVIVEAPPHPDAIVEEPSADDPDLLGEAELFMDRSSNGGAAGAHRVGAAR